MGKFVVYGNLASPPVRTVLLTLTELGLEYELKSIYPAQGEHLSEDFLKKNPQHTIPVLDDDGEYIWDSHAIAAYLVRKYGKSDVLYPKDFLQRATVDQRLHFESGVLFTKALKGFLSPNKSQENKVADVEEAYDFLEAFVENTYIAGDHLTIADLSILSSTSTLNLLVPVNANEKTPKLSAWLELMKQLPYYEEINGKGLEEATQIINSKKTAAETNGDV